ncbi:glycosyltransferase [Pseudomonas borbori]
MSVSASKVLVVLGMHRSGTSALTRGLQALGVELGGNLMPAFEGNNSKGFWEDLEIVAINDALLEQCGQSWHSLGDLSQCNWTALLASPYGRRAVDYLAAQIERYRLFAFKDPRMARLLPFWKLVFQRLGVTPVFLIASRNPISVALSLEKRDGFPAEKSHLLWIEHCLPSLLETQGYKRMVISYDRLLASPREQLQRIARLSGLEEPSEADLVEYSESFLDKQLRHSHFSVEDIQGNPGLLAETRLLFELLEQLATDAQDLNDSNTSEVLNNLMLQLRRYMPLRALLATQEHSVLNQQRQISLLEQQLQNAVIAHANELAQQHAVQEQLTEQAQLFAQQKKHLEHQVARLQQDLLSAHASMAEIRSSTSWRLTQPLRSAGSFAKRLVGWSRRSLRSIARALYFRLPQRFRAPLLNWVFSRLGFLFRTSIHYENWRRQQQVSRAEGIQGLYGLLYETDAESPSTGRYALEQSYASQYCYLPPRRTTSIDQALSGFARHPLISIITPVYGVAPRYLEKLIQSVEQQWYSNWELILVEDAGPNEETRRFMRGLDEPRIKVRFLEQNGGISHASNIALSMAQGEYVAFLDHDDELTLDALYEVVKVINEHDPDLIYSDEDKIDATGNFSDPFFKPGWSPDALMSIMYTCHLCCIRSRLVEAIGGLRLGYEGAQDYDLILRITEQTQRVVHIPKVLYHWRILPSSIASSIDAKPYASDAVRRVKEDALQRRMLSGCVESVAHMPGQFRINYRPVGTPLVSIIIPTRDNYSILRQCIESILERTRYENYEIILMDNQSVDEDSLAYYHSLDLLPQIQLQRYPHPFNYSAINNLASRYAAGEYLLFLNDDTQVMEGDWLERLLGFAQLEHVGAVGAKLLFPGSERIQHCGVLNLADGPGHAFYNARNDMPLYFGRNILDWNWLAVTGACLMVARHKFESIGGFDEALPIAYNDVDLCLGLHRAGWHNVVCSAVALVHHESVSRGVDHEDVVKLKRLGRERRKLFHKHPGYFMRDPYYNNNLHQNSVDFLVLNY